MATLSKHTYQRDNKRTLFMNAEHSKKLYYSEGTKR